MKKFIIILTISFVFTFPFISFIMYLLSNIVESLNTLDDTDKQFFAFFITMSMMLIVYFIVNITITIVEKLGFYTNNDLHYTQKRLDKIKKALEKNNDS